MFGVCRLTTNFTQEPALCHDVLNPLGPTVIKGKLLQSSYEQLWAVQYSLRVAVNPPAKYSMKKLTGDLLLELKFVKLEILSTSFKDFLYGELGELVIWV